MQREIIRDSNRLFISKSSKPLGLYKVPVSFLITKKSNAQVVKQNSSDLNCLHLYKSSRIYQILRQFSYNFVHNMIVLGFRFSSLAQSLDLFQFLLLFRAYQIGFLYDEILFPYAGYPLYYFSLSVL